MRLRSAMPPWGHFSSCFQIWRCLHFGGIFLFWGCIHFWDCLCFTGCLHILGCHHIYIVFLFRLSSSFRLFSFLSSSPFLVHFHFSGPLLKLSIFVVQSLGAIKYSLYMSYGTWQHWLIEVSRQICTKTQTEILTLWWE